MTSPIAFKILVIDDHPETLSIIQRVLQQHGYNVLGARSGFRGLSLAESENPDMVMVDGMMPEMDGWEVCRRLRAMPNLADMPIIMFTAVDEAEQKLAGFDAGADDYLTKPTEPAELLERVKTMFEDRTPKAAAQTRLHKPLPEANKRKGVGDTSAPLTRSVTFSSAGSVTAILGARGGAGATTLAINLASSLASSSQATTLLDLDLVQGHVALYLSQKHQKGLNNVLTQPESQWSHLLKKELYSYAENLELLLVHTQHDEPPLPLEPEQTLNLLQPLIKPNHQLIVDCGHQLTAVVESILAQANQIIVCLRPERVALANARQLLEHLHEIAPEEATVRAIIFDFSGQMAIPHQTLEKFLNHPLTAVLPMPPAEMNQAVNKSVPLVQLNPHAKAAILIRQIAQKLVQP
ncbi:response regulator [Candidatus Leptofilum sp.]|uniref:response regulator n=1 Tax=Candidatus Leptofilum sp. TaxID=3241576 RepID=UPI003B5BAE41